MNVSFAPSRPLLVPRHAALLVAWALTLGAAPVWAETAAMRFRLRDGGVVTGVPVGSPGPGRLALRNQWFDRPLSLPLDQVLEAARVPPRPAARGDGQAEPPSQNPANDLAGKRTSESNEKQLDASRLGFRLVDGSLIFGRVESSDRQRVRVRSDDLGLVTIARSELTDVFGPAGLPRVSRSLASTPHRFRPTGGWELRPGRLVSQAAAGAMVTRLDLPLRFHIRLAIRCEGTPDFELALGDRSEAGAGRGGRDGFRGGSVARSPSEAYTTQVSWIGESLTLLRSDPSVADVRVAPLAKRAFVLDVWVDQSRGRLAARVDGERVGEVVLRDAEPQRRGRLTLTNRGDAIEIDEFTLFDWQGELPTPVGQERPRVMLRDGTTLAEPVTEWQPERFQVAGQWYPIADLQAWHTDRSRSRQTSTPPADADHFRLAGGSLVWATLEPSDEPRDASGGQSSGELVLRRGRDRYAVSPSRLRSIGGQALPAPGLSDAAAELTAEGLRLEGDLMPARHRRGGFGWRPVWADEPLDLAEMRAGDARAAAEIRFRDVPGADADRPVSRSGSGIEFAGGDWLPADGIRVAEGRARFESVYCRKGVADASQLRRVVLGGGPRAEPGSADPNRWAFVLRVPRQQQAAPPTHLILAINGDALRGKLVALGEDQVRLAVRGVVRKFPRARISQLIRLEASAVKEPSSAAVETVDGAELSLDGLRLVDGVLEGRHAVLGPCRIPLSRVRRVTLGRGVRSPPWPWRLKPVKRPRSFEKD